MVVVVGNLLGSDNGGILGIGERPVGDSGLCSGGQWGRDFEIPQLHTGNTRDTAVYQGGQGIPQLALHWGRGSHIILSDRFNELSKAAV